MANTMSCALGLTAILSFGNPCASVAQDFTKWWPLSATSVAADGSEKSADYVPLAATSTPRRVCALFPHLRDSIWLSVNYGLVEEARRLGVGLSVFEAGGYENLPKQIAQFDDCLVGNYDAIILGAISEGGLAQKLRDAEKAKIPVIAVVNLISEAPVAGRVYPIVEKMNAASAALIATALNGAEGKVLTITGPAGSGWAERSSAGIKRELANVENVEVIGQLYGDTSVSAQLSLVQDAVQSYPEMNVLYGTAPTIEAAVGVLEVVGRQDILLVPTYENDAVLGLVKDGRIDAFVSQFPVAQGRIAMDMAIRAIEGKLETTFVYPDLKVLTTHDMATMEIGTAISAPEGFSATYSVSPR